MSHKKSISITGSNNELNNFLEDHRIIGKNTGIKPTHTSWGKVMGKYSIPDSDLERFYKIYYEEVKKGHKLSIIEMHKEIGMMIVDLDFKFKESVTEREYTTSHIEKIVKYYFEEIEDSFIFNSEEDKSTKMVAFVLEKKKPYQNKGCTRDGIHIIFPHIVSVPNIQYIIRDNVIKKCELNHIFDNISLINGISDIIDRSVIYKNGFFMLGSSKPYSEPYNITLIYDRDMNKLESDEVEYGNIKNMVKFLSIRRHKEKDCLSIKKDKIEDMNKLLKKQNVMKINQLKKFATTKYDIEQIKKLVDILSVDRATNFESWIQVGWCLHNINPVDEELLKLWIDFSKKTSGKNFKKGECDKLWGTFKKNGNLLTLGSLHYWAKCDNLEKYIEIKRDNVKFFVDRSLNSSNWDVAKVLYEMFKYNYVFSSVKFNIWYVFKDHRWIEDDGGITLRSQISTELVKEYCHIITNYNKQHYAMSKKKDENSLNSDEKNEIERNLKKLEDKIKTLTTIIGNLKTTSFKDNIIKECKELFYDSTFIDKLDENPYIIGFDNGVYDLKNNKFRDGTPDDYVSTSVGYDYIPYDENNETVDDVKNIIKQILPNYNVREYVMKMLASCLQGFNAEQKFRIWVGCGSNGKTLLKDFFINTIGDYSIKFNTTLLTSKRAASNAATPEIAKGKGKRFGYFEEPSEGEKINVGLMKEFTGGDKISARGLYKAPIEFKPMWKLLLLCNDLPEVPPYDIGVWRRIEVVEFISRFVHNPKEENEYPIDEKLPEKIIEWKDTFMSILLEYYKKYANEGLLPPEEVVKYTLEYKRDADMFLDFFDKMFVKGSQRDIISLDTIFRNIKIWCQRSSVREISKRELKNYITKKYGKNSINGNTLIGYKNSGYDFENNSDDLSDYNIIDTHENNIVEIVEIEDSETKNNNFPKETNVLHEYDSDDERNIF